MKIVFLCKRAPQNRDLYKRPYGRFFHMPRFLARAGFQVTLILVDYSGNERLSTTLDELKLHIVPLNKFNPFSTLEKIEQIVTAIAPDWISGLSDTWYGVIAHRIGQKHGYKVFIDAYDNYESYIPWLLPLHWLWRNACRNANLLSAAGPQLLALMNLSRDTKKASCVIPMAADSGFYPLDKDNCRKKLNLPNTFLVGYLGSLHPNRDPKQFFSIVSFTAQIDPTIKFIISGKKHSSIIIPKEIKPHIVELGYIADEDMPTACNAMDILLAIGQPSKFGDYAYPVKIYEGLVCGKIVMATRTQSTEWILKDTPENLITWRDEKNTAEKIVSNKLTHRKQEPINKSWEDNFNILVKYLRGDI